MKEMQQVGLTVTLSHVTSNREPYNYSVLKIEDRRSGFTVAKVKLLPEQVYELLTSRHVFREEGIPGHVINSDTCMFVGKQAHAFTRLFRRDYNVRVFPSDDPGSSPHLNSWGRMVMGALWAHSFSWGMRNNGVNFTVWRYTNDLTPEMIEKAKKMLELYPAPEGLK